jgi:hypothetical protein
MHPGCGMKCALVLFIYVHSVFSSYGFYKLENMLEGLLTVSTVTIECFLKIREHTTVRIYLVVLYVDIVEWFVKKNNIYVTLPLCSHALLTVRTVDPRAWHT